MSRKSAWATWPSWVPTRCDLPRRSMSKNRVLFTLCGGCTGEWRGRASHGDHQEGFFPVFQQTQCAAMSSCMARRHSPSSTSTAATPVSQTGPQSGIVACHCSHAVYLVASKQADLSQFVSFSHNLMRILFLGCGSRACCSLRCDTCSKTVRSCGSCAGIVQKH